MRVLKDKIISEVPAVVLYAIGIFLFTGALKGDFSTGLIRMASVTAVACPCAWALSVPTAFAATIGGLSGQGILANGGIPLEVVGEASTVVLDKTGTVTLGEPKVVGIESFGMPEDKLLQIAVSIEAGFNHPIAQAIVSHASAKGIVPLGVTDPQYLPGFGIKAFVEGQEVIMGATETIKSHGLNPPSKKMPNDRPTWVVISGEVMGAIIIQDELKEYASGLGKVLHHLGLKKVILATGDNEEAEAQRVAQLIGADEYYWGMKPDDKAKLIKENTKEGYTIMVGDGVNDATALAAADVGISMGHTNADLAIKSSDIIILRNDASSLQTIVSLGKKLIRVIKQNYAWAIGFNTVGIVFATMGYLAPWSAALFHHISSILVVLNSARLAKVASHH